MNMMRIKKKKVTILLLALSCGLFMDSLLCVKRTISEVQLMHNVREHKQVGERQDWLQEKLKEIIVASSKPQHGQSGNIKNLFSNYPDENL
uniref:Parathyroid hormone n=1 Tax=Acanthochromis polyacanthus TaxID=80966 RepID=A0A3Q1F5H7_9TELE